MVVWKWWWCGNGGGVVWLWCGLVVVWFGGGGSCGDGEDCEDGSCDVKMVVMLRK